jgi:hypothetical protein
MLRSAPCRGQPDGPLESRRVELVPAYTKVDLPDRSFKDTVFLVGNFSVGVGALLFQCNTSDCQVFLSKLD